MEHPKGYTKEMIKEILGTSWTDPPGESGNEMRKRKGREMREGKIPYPVYNKKKTGERFDENGKYIYPPNSGFSYVQWIKDHPDSTEAGTYGSKVS